MVRKFDLSNERLLDFYRQMLLIRSFEEKIEYGFSRNEIHGTTHLCIGQEAVPVGVCANLDSADYVVSNHRGHGHALSKGLTPDKLFAEIMGKEDGYCNGKGGTQHVAYLEKGFLGTNGITGGGIPIATGAAFTIKYKGLENISVCFFGDGATNQGTFHESLNMASLWKLPVLYVCENNFYAMSTHTELTISNKSIADRADAYNIEGIHVNGMDVMEVYNASKEAVKKIRKGSGPILLECQTYRFKGHSKSDPRIYRSKEEESHWGAKCPVLNFRDFVLKEKITEEDDLKKLEEAVFEEIENAYKFALNSPFPQNEEALKDIYYEYRK